MDEINNITEAVQGTAEETTKPSFDDLLKDPDYQAEFDRKAEGMKKKWEASWQKKAEKERSEAEALAKMTEEEKHQHELQKIDAERNQALAELNAYKLKDEAQKIAIEKGIDVSLLDLLDFSKATAEEVKDKIEQISATFGKAVEKAVNEKLKQPKPQEVRNPSLTPNQEYLNKKYGKNIYYKQK